MFFAAWKCEEQTTEYVFSNKLVNWEEKETEKTRNCNYLLKVANLNLLVILNTN